MPKDNPSVGSSYFSAALKTLLTYLRARIIYTHTRRWDSALIVFLLLSLSLFGAFTGFVNAPVHAQATNNTLNYQARILLSSGALVPDGDYHVEFKIYNSSVQDGGQVPDQGACTVNAGSADEDCLWVETRSSGNLVRVVNGYVSVSLGSVTAFPSNIPWSSQLYVTMRVGGTSGPTWDTEMVNPTTGRMRITAVPYAFSAANVASGATTGASTNSDNVTIETGNASGATSNSGSISLNVGSATGTRGSISIGAGANAPSSILIGQAGTSTTLQGPISVTGTGTALTVTNNVQIDGNTILGSNSSDTLVVNAAASLNANLAVDTSLLFVDVTNDFVNIGSASDQSARFAIIGANDEEQLLIRAAAGQTVANPLVLLQDSSSVELARINATTTSLYFGNAAGGNSAAGVNNTGIGASALGSVSTGTGNTTLGSGALASVSVNNNNTAVGYNAGNLATGGNNIFLGALAGDNVTTGTDNIIIGYNLDASAAGVNNELRIGGVLQGNTSTLAAQFNGALTTVGILTASATGGNALAITGAPTNSATSSLIQIGSAIAGGNSAANGGTYIGLNAPAAGAGSAADLLNLQVNGSSRLQVTGGGATLIRNTVDGETALRIIASSGQTADLAVFRNSTNLATLAAFTENGSLLTPAIGDVAETGPYIQFGASTQTARPRTNTQVGFIIRGQASQSGDLLQLQNNTPTTLSGFNSAGNLFYTNAGFTSVLSSAALSAGRSIVLPDADGTVCLQSSSSCGFTTGTGTAIVQVPASSAANTITPTANSVVGLTVNGTSGTATTALAISQPGAAAGITIASANNTATNGLSFSGTFTNLISATNFSVTNAGSLTAVGVNSGSGLLQGTGGLTLTGTAQINATGAGTTTVGSGSGGAILIQSGSTIGIGNNANAQTLTVGNTTGATALNLRVGTGNFSLDGVAGSTYTLGASTTTGTVTIGGTAQTGNLILGSSSGTNSVLIGNGAGTTTVNIANATTDGAVNIGAAMTTGTITIGGTGAQTGTLALGTGTGVQTINLATGGTGAKTVTLGSTASTSSLTLQSGTGNLNITTQGTGSLNVGNNAVAQTINVGNTTGATALNLRAGTGNFTLDGVAGTTYTLGASTTTGTMTIGGTAQTGNLTLGSSSGTNSILIGDGVGSTTVNIANTTTAGAVNIGSAFTTGTISIGGTGAQTGSISLGTGTGTQSISLASGAGVKTVLLGSTNSTSTTTLQSGTNGLIMNVAGTQQAIFAGSNTLYLGNASTAGTAASPNAFTVQATGSSTAATAGAALSMYAGTGNTSGAGGALTLRAGTGGTSGVGGVLTLQGGTAGASSGNGGNVALVGGTSAAGTKGLVIVDTFTLSTAGAQNCAATPCAITQANIDSYGALLITTNATGYTVTLSDPTLGASATGRLIYITNADATDDFVLSANGGTEQINLKPNTTATMIWNGSDWTAAGASSSTDLQAAYDNTAASAGGAEIVLSSAGTGGLTIRNDASSAITGGLLEVQTSIGSNLFTVNNNASEYATNGGAETAGASASTFPATTWDTTTGGTVDRYQSTTGGFDSANLATGQASVRMVTTTTNHGARNRISTSLTSGLTYNVSFAVRGATNFATLQVLYSPDGTTSGTTTCATAQTVTSGQWSRITCSFVASGTITSSNSILIRQTDATGRTFYIDNLSVNVNASANHAADGSVDSSGSFATNWTDYQPSGTATESYESTIIYDTTGSAQLDTSATAGIGIRNNMAITPQISTQYLVSFYIYPTSTMTSSVMVGFLPAGGTGVPSGSAACTDYNTQTAALNTWTKITCLFTTPGSGISNPDLLVYQSDATARTFYVDALSITLNTNNSNNVQIGGGNKGGPVTLFTLDRSAGAPIAANNDAYLGSMFYDTVTGRIQCYEADGWGACGGAPDNIVNLNPEYAGSVLYGTGVGTMTADFCSNDAALSVNSSLCGAGQAKNYYRWTSPQASAQTYSIFITYQLPSTFNDFASDSTVQLTARTDSTTNASVTYQMFQSVATAGSEDVVACGTATTVVTSANTWQTVGINGNEATSCTFNASDFVIFRLNLTAEDNANAYVSTLSFTTTGK